MRLNQPPSGITGETRRYLEDICRALNAIPQISYFSGLFPTASGVTGVAGNLCVNVGVASNASRLFIHYGSVRIPDVTSWQTVA